MLIYSAPNVWGECDPYLARCAELGGKLLYLDVTWTYSPLLAYIYYVFSIFFGATPVMVRVPAGIADTVIAVILWKIGRALGREAAGMLAGLLYLFFPLTISADYYGKVTPILMPFLIGAYLLYLTDRRVESAILLGVSFLVQVTALIFFLPFLIYEKRQSLTYYLQAAIIPVAVYGIFFLLSPRRTMAGLYYQVMERSVGGGSWLEALNLPTLTWTWNGRVSTIQYGYLLLLGGMLLFGLVFSWWKKLPLMTSASLIGSIFIVFNRVFSWHYVIWVLPFLCYFAAERLAPYLKKA